MQTINIFWFRRDLRLHDNAGLYHALKNGNPVLPVFIFDKNILDKLEDKDDQRVSFIHTALEKLQKQLIILGSSLEIYYDKPIDAFKKILAAYKVQKVFTNHDYEPYAKKRDDEINDWLHENNAAFFTYKDQVIFEKDEVLKDDNKPYTVFTPYSKKWKSMLNDFYLKEYPTEKYFNNFLKRNFFLQLPVYFSLTLPRNPLTFGWNGSGHQGL